MKIQVLTQKVSDNKWKKILCINKSISQDLIYIDDITKYITKLTYENNVVCDRNQLWNLIDKLSNLIEQQNFIDLLQTIDTYYIYKDRFYPQITISTNQNIYRYFYHPLYSYKKHYIDILISHLYPHNKVFYFDINGAIVRSLFLVGYLHLKYQTLLDWFNTEHDIYDIISPLCNINNDNREQIKLKIISSIFKRDINFFRSNIIKYILSNFQMSYVCRVLNMYILKTLPTDVYLVHFNFDGGYIITDRELSLPKFWRIQCISEMKQTTP